MPRNDGLGAGRPAPPYPCLLLLVFCVMLPCSALLADVLFFVVAMAPGGVERNVGVLPGPLGLLFSSGTGWMAFAVGFVMTRLRFSVEENAGGIARVPASGCRSGMSLAIAFPAVDFPMCDHI